MTRVGRVADGDRALAVPAEPASGLIPSGFDPSRGCQCRLCRYDSEFAEHIAFVPVGHRAFFEELKERWEATDFDAQWFRGCVGGEEYTAEFCAAYDEGLAKVKRRGRDSDGSPEGGDANAAPSRSDDSAGPKGIAQGERS